MKTLISKILAAVLVALTFAVPEAVEARAEITWLNDSVGFGAFSEDDGQRTCAFRYVNTGDEPLVIVAARATCGCTRPTFSQEPIAPGDTAEVSVSFNPVGRTGRFTKYVYVDTNTDPERSRLTLSGTVVGDASTVGQRFPVAIGPLRLRNGALMMGEVKKGHVKSVPVQAYNSAYDSIRPEIVRAPDYIDISFQPAVAAPGEQVGIMAIVDASRCPLYGVVDDSVTIVADPVLASEPVTLPIVMIVNEDFESLTPQQLDNAPVVALSEQNVDFDRISGPAKREVKLTNRGKSTLLVRRLYGGSDAIAYSISATEIKPGKSAVITVEVDPAKIGGKMLNDRLTLITNDPAKPNSVIRVKGVPTAE